MWVTISHPPVNLLDVPMLMDLSRLVGELAAADASRPDATRVVVLRSADPEFFIAHADLEMIKALPREPQPYPTELGFFHAFVERWRTLPQVTIAQIEGRARGGGSELALSLDLRFAAIGRAVLAQPEVAIGIIPGGSGTQRLGRLLGRGRALEAILGCADFDAVTAERYGWVNRALPDDEIGPFVDQLARRIASFPPAAVRLAKQAVDAALPPPHDGLLAEAHAFNQTLTDPELDARFDAALAAGAQTRAGGRARPPRPPPAPRLTPPRSGVTYPPHTWVNDAKIERGAGSASYASDPWTETGARDRHEGGAVRLLRHRRAGHELGLRRRGARRARLPARVRALRSLVQRRHRRDRPRRALPEPGDVRRVAAAANPLDAGGDRRAPRRVRGDPGEAPRRELHPHDRGVRRGAGRPRRLAQRAACAWSSARTGTGTCGRRSRSPASPRTSTPSSPPRGSAPASPIPASTPRPWPRRTSSRPRPASSATPGAPT